MKKPHRNSRAESFRTKILCVNHANKREPDLRDPSSIRQ